MDTDVPHDRQHVFYPRVGEQNKAAHVASSTNNLNYYGGAVLNTPIVYVAYWGAWSPTDGEYTYFNSFLSGVGGSSWLGTTTQYYSSAGGNITNPSAQLAGTYVDTTSIPSHPSDSAIRQAAVRAANHFGIGTSGHPAVTAVAIIVATQHGHSTRGFGTQWCAYHGYASTNKGDLSYTDFPYQTDAGASCGENFINGGTAGKYDGVSVVGGHEYAESITDPFPSSGWLDSGGSEIGDKCAWSSLSGNITLSTGTFAVQPLWSNAATGCVL